MIPTIDGVRVYRCFVCRTVGEWLEGWRWESSPVFAKDVREILYTCSDECREAK